MTTYKNIQAFAEMGRQVAGLEHQFRTTDGVWQRKLLHQRQCGVVDAARWVLMAERERETGEAQPIPSDEAVRGALARAAMEVGR